jgi:hypothetical protein
MYSTSFANGVKVFNDKKWEEAVPLFLRLLNTAIISLKTNGATVAILFDTTSILYLAYAYQNSSKPAEAAKYYGRLADNKVGW